MVGFLIRICANSYVKLLSLLSALIFFGYGYFLSGNLKSDICLSQQTMCLSAGMPYVLMNTICASNAGDFCVNGYSSSCLFKYSYDKNAILSMWSPSTHDYIPYALAIICLSCISFCFEFISYVYGPEVVGTLGGLLGIMKILSSGPLPLITVFLMLLSAKEFIFIFPENCKVTNPNCSNLDSCGVDIRSVLLTNDFFLLNFGSFAVAMAVALLIGSALSIWGHALIEREYILATRMNSAGIRLQALLKVWKVVDVVPPDADECPICLRSLSGDSSSSSGLSIHVSARVHPSPDSGPHSPPYVVDVLTDRIEAGSRSRQQLPNIINPSIVIQIQCHHLFHKHCISEWAERHDNCPVCRADLTRQSNVPPTAAPAVTTI